jgi:hypothetical protein
MFRTALCVVSTDYATYYDGSSGILKSELHDKYVLQAACAEPVK